MAIHRTEVFIPSSAVAEITLEGVTFRLSVEGLPLYFERLFPELLAGDEDRSLFDQGKTVAPEISASLDEAARQFLHRFAVSSSQVLEAGLNHGAQRDGAVKQQEAA